MIVGVSAAVRWNGFGTSDYCWLSTQHGTIWAFIGPVLCIIAFNIFVFVRIMMAILAMRRQPVMLGDERKRFEKLKKGLRASLSFMCLLGITWVFGAFAIGQAAVAFFYLFAILNALQGVVIFTFQVLLDPKYVHICINTALMCDAGSAAGCCLARRRPRYPAATIPAILTATSSICNTPRARQPKHARPIRWTTAPPASSPSRLGYKDMMAMSTLLQ